MTIRKPDVPCRNIAKRLPVALLLAATFVVGAKAHATTNLTLTLPVKTVSFAPIFLAIDDGQFAKRDISVKIVVVRGGAPSIASLLAGNAQFISVADDELLKVAKTGKVIRVYSFTNSFTQCLQVRDAVIKARGISLDMPVYERIRKLKGTTSGVIIPGGSSDLAGRWLFKQAGLDPQNDIHVLRIGGLPALVAAMRVGKIDWFVLSPPAGPIVEATHIGKLVVRYDEIPQFDYEPFLGIDTTPNYIKSHRKVVQQVVDAVAEAQAILYKDPMKAAAILKKNSFSSISLPVLKKSLAIMRHAFRPKKMTQKGWNFVSDMRVTLGHLEYKVPMKKGVNWTNEFYPK